MKRVLVTGGAGFIGSNLVLELERRGVRVVVLDDFSVGHFENLKGFKGDVVAGDVCRPETWTGRVGGVDTVFHQAANTDTTVTDQRRMMETNVEAFRVLLEFAAQTGVGRVVYASSAGIYGAGACPMVETQPGAPMNVYGFSKMIMENVAAAWTAEEPSVGLVGLRYFNVYGPRERHKAKAASMIWQLYAQMRAGRRPRIFRAGEQCRDHIYVKDVVEANLKAAQADEKSLGRVYNVCTGRKTDFNRIVELLNGVLGTELESEYFENPFGFYQNETLGDPAAAKTGIGFEAGYSIEDGIRDYFAGKPEAAAAAGVV